MEASFASFPQFSPPRRLDGSPRKERQTQLGRDATLDAEVRVMEKTKILGPGRLKGEHILFALIRQKFGLGVDMNDTHMLIFLEKAPMNFTLLLQHVLFKQRPGNQVADNFHQLYHYDQLY